MGWLSSSKTLIDACNSLAGWAGAGSGSVTITDAPALSGQTQALRVLSSGTPGANYQITRDLTPTDYATGWYSQWVRFPNLATAKNTGHFLWRTQFSSNGYYQRLVDINSLSEETIASNNEWINIMWLGGEMNAASGAPAYTSNTTWFAKLYLRTTNIATGGAIDFGALYAKVKQSRPAVVICFDDSNDTDYTIAFPYLQALGLKATTYTIAGQINQTNFLTSAQILELRSAGWTVGTHGDFSYTTLTNQELRDDLNLNKNFLIGLGIDSWPHVSYPPGDFNPNTVSTIKSMGFKTGRTTISRSYPIIPERGYFHLQGEGTSSWANAAAGIAAVDSAIANGGTLVMFTHRLQPGVSPTHTDTTLWQTVIDYIATQRNAGTIDVLTMEELYAASATASESRQCLTSLGLVRTVN